ncbi:MAG: SoxR reducing system RseC family protein [Fibrobacter sp.]|nr:SoxR reducing system RseC family protein [Fibrobacter sp.]
MGQLLTIEEKEGIIFRKQNDRLFISIDPECDTRQCRTGCGACGGNSKVKKTIVTTDNAAQYQIGQTVTFRRFLLNEALGALIVFGIPLFMALLMVTVWLIKAPERVETPLALFTTGISFISGFAIVWFIDFLFRRKFPSCIVKGAEKTGRDQ